MSHAVETEGEFYIVLVILTDIC